MATDCYSTGSVTGSTNVGGFTGGLSGGGATDCFWDTETSGQSGSPIGEGKTTAQMKRVGTYLSDPSLALGSWDFTIGNDICAFNGTNYGGYPFLRYQGYTPGYVWLGTSSTDWTATTNWSENAEPVSGNKVFIPDVVTDPIVNTAVVSSFLKIEYGGFLTIASGALTIPPAGLLTIASGGRMTATGSLTNNAGVAGIVIESDASLVHTSAGVDGTVNRAITSNGKWHFLSCPINQSPMPEICDGNFAPPTAFFNSFTGTLYDFFFWQEPFATGNLNWISLKNPDWSVNTTDFGNPPRFVTGKGYLVEYSSTYLGSPEKAFTGTLGVGSIVIPVTSTAGGNSYNLIGNSYPSSIDWKAVSGWDRSPLEDNAGGKDLWIWNDAAGNYGVYNSALPGDAGTNGITRYIAPEQGFFVKAATNGNVNMDDNVRCHSSQAWLKSDDECLRINVTSSINSYSDEVLLGFGYLDTGGAEKWFSMYAEAPSLYLPVGENNYSLRFLNDVLANPAIPMSFKAGQDGNYTFTLTGTDVFPNVILQDLKTGSTQDLKTNPVYKFSSLTADDANRFLLRFTPVGIESKQTGNCSIYVYDNVLNVSNPGESVIAVHNMTGNKILE